VKLASASAAQIAAAELRRASEVAIGRNGAAHCARDPMGDGGTFWGMARPLLRRRHRAKKPPGSRMPENNLHGEVKVAFKKRADTF
jgi:hypothetical protein